MFNSLLLTLLVSFYTPEVNTTTCIYTESFHVVTVAYTDYVVCPENGPELAYGWGSPKNSDDD